MCLCVLMHINLLMMVSSSDEFKMKKMLQHFDSSQQRRSQVVTTNYNYQQRPIVTVQQRNRQHRTSLTPIREAMSGEESSNSSVESFKIRLRQRPLKTGRLNIEFSPRSLSNQNCLLRVEGVNITEYQNVESGRNVQAPPPSPTPHLLEPLPQSLEHRQNSQSDVGKHLKQLIDTYNRFYAVGQETAQGRKLGKKGHRWIQH